jgi:gas vesicle structural protein
MAGVQLREPRPFAAAGELTADAQEQVTLRELLDRVLDKGVVLCGDITLSVADIDLVYISLRVLLSSVESMSDTGRSSG